MGNMIKYPVGIQTFSQIIEGGYLYVDKTMLVHELVNSNKYVFLSRPRRFGKSLLLSTIQAYFEGRRELFAGLAVAGLEKAWDSYPVLRFDLSGESYEHPSKLEGKLNLLLREYEDIYGKEEDEVSIGSRFRGIIRRAVEKTGRKAVVLIDEYDKPLLETMHEEELHESARLRLRGFYGVLKESDEFIRFAMLTGVTKFGQVTIFSGLNNLNDISMLKQYNNICGISESEFRDNFKESVSIFAGNSGESEENVWEEFKKNYDGYHFCYPGEGIYNPFSVLTAFANSEIENYWFRSGSPDYLIKIFKKTGFVFSDIEGQRSSADDLKDMTNPERNLIALLYQSGYLTIKGYDATFKEYTLGFPNMEVSSGFWSSLYRNYVFQGDRQSAFDMSRFVRDVFDGKVCEFMERLQALVASVSPGTLKDKEIYFQNILQVIFSMVGFHTQTEIAMASGRADMVVKSARFIYVFEFKIDSTAKKALQQILDKGYAEPYRSDSRPLFLIGANFSSETNTLSDFVIEKRH